ncbi:hypothetical protein D0C16_05600 [Cellvibrio sp. KY-GH-1]|uniref:sigma factor-like helix-turn-helix DNA-binding protein n=1 Tax=Cellvibrio sp. KY-GH-1 TaxID=2303332 RepID=UPI00124743A7|nr:sigma factor-like helix-turn-helix DNA-binding protein [Cellvibrio sp. KY-GH-1]QEY15495.1 hypothetical protein D0C16_05600 [Cellvibrio sp. KY-GH-1]
MRPLPQRTETGYTLGNLIVEGLPPRQSQILLMRALGLTAKEIASTLQCSAANVEQAINILFFKLKANSSSELVTKAFLSQTLRMLSFALFFVGIFGINPPDSNTNVRIPRTRTTQTARIQRGGNNKKLWG